MSLPVDQREEKGKKSTDAVETVTAEQDDQYLTFKLREEMFAVGIMQVKEILEYGGVTPVPMMPDFIRGVINLRGSVVPVIDLSVRFNGERNDADKRSCIVIVEVNAEQGQQDIGIMVDSVSEVMEIGSQDIEPSPAFGARIRTDFIAGMGKTESGFVIILAVDCVLSVQELVMLSDIAERETETASSGAEEGRSAEQ